MGCSGDREKGPKEQSQKWAYLTLSDFRCTSVWTGVAYGWLIFLCIVGIAVYVVDTWTAVNLLAFDRWSSKVQPALDFKYSKWIFSVCILLSWALCFYEWIRAIRVIRRGGVAESFLDPLAVDIQSLRPQGWRRFLVFAALTNSKKGADYVALFVYFSFKTAIRVILAEGPRVGVNAMTLYAVLQADIIPSKDEGHSNFEQFWINIGALANEDKRQAVIYFGMLFTLVIWVFSALSLIISGILYICFLWHYIPQRDGRLSVYCRRKVDKRLERIVASKVQKAIEDEERKQRKAEEKAQLKRQKTGDLEPVVQAKIGITKQPTLPTLDAHGDQLPPFPLRRQGTESSVATLPPYSVGRQPTLPDLGPDTRPGINRTNTNASEWSSAPSYATNASLLSNAGMPGRSESPLPPLPVSRQDSYSSLQQPCHGRSASQSTQGSMRSFGPGPYAQTPMSARPYSPMGPGAGAGYPRAPPHPRGPTSLRSHTTLSYEEEPHSALSVSSSDSYNRSFTAPVRSQTADNVSRPVAPPLRTNTAAGFHTGPKVNEEYWQSIIQNQNQSFHKPLLKQQPSVTSFSRPYTPASSQQSLLPAQQHNSYEMTARPAHSNPATQNSSPNTPGAYVAFNPGMQAPAPAAASPTIQQGPRRNITIANGPHPAGDHFRSVREVPQRSATAPLEPHRHPSQRAESSRESVSDILDDYGQPSPNTQMRRPEPPADPVQQRSYTAPQHDWRRYS